MYKWDRKNQQLAFARDAQNRVIRKIDSGNTVYYSYDAAGRMTQAQDNTGTYGFTYDNIGRLTETTTNYTFLTARGFTVQYGYDAASNRTTLTDPESGTTHYTYDTLNRLTGLNDFQSHNFTFSYDALSRRTQLTRPNGINTNYSYDNVSHLLSVLHQFGSTTVDGASYTYDSAGNRTAKTDQASSVTSNYGYDAIYQLTGVSHGSTTTESYTYDTVGNRLSSLGVSPYSYNSSNELTSTPSTTYTYDNNGSTVTKVDSTGTTTYTWDYVNQMSSVALPGSGGTVSFKYDPFGRRIQKSIASGTVNYLYDGPNLLEEVDQSGSVLVRYTQGLGVDEPLAELRSGVTSYYDADWLGSVTSLSNSSGALSNTYSYDSYGKLVASTGTVTNSFRYTGREFDTETGAYFYRARYYDQASGRFLSEDPIGFTGGTNFYRYARNNPAGFIDPSGDVVINPGKFPSGSVADVVLALQRIRDGLAKNPGCDCYFRSHGLT
jgi:RHS repeat-associated protein